MSKPYHFREHDYSHTLVKETYTPAVPTSVTLQCDIGWKLKPLYGKAKLVTDANVANRYVNVEVQDFFSNIICQVMGSSAIAASSTANNYITNKDSDAGEELGDVVVYNNDKLVINFLALEATDTVEVRLKYLKVPINEPFPPSE